MNHAGVLHRGPQGSGSVPVVWLRDGATHRGELELEDGWRRTVLDWRMSVSQGNIGASPGFFPLAATADDRKRLGIPEGKMAVRPFLGEKKGLAWDAGIRPDHVITAVDGKAPDKHGRAFLVWFRLRYDPGAEVTFTVRDGQGEEKTPRYRVGRTW